MAKVIIFTKTRTVKAGLLITISYLLSCEKN